MIRILGIASVVLCISLNCPSAVGSAVTKEQFREEGPRGWQATIDFAKHLDEEVLNTREWSGKLAHLKPLHSQDVVKFNGDSAVYHQKLLDGPKVGFETVLAVNPNYTFELTRDKEDRPWLVKSLSDDTNSKRQLFWNDAYPLSVYNLQIHDKWLPDMIREPGFVVNSVNMTNREGQELVEVDFDYSHPPDAFAGLRGGKIWFDRDSHWAVKEYDVRIQIATGEPQWGKSACTYVTDENKFPRLVTKEDRTGDSSGQLFRSLYEFQKYEPIQVPSDAFTLSAFGLPELATRSRMSSARWYVPAIVSIGLILLAVVLRRRARGAT